MPLPHTLPSQVVKEFQKQLEELGLQSDHEGCHEPAPVSMSCDLSDVDLAAWLFCHGVSAGDILKDSIFYQVVASMVLTAYGFRSPQDSWEQFQELYEFSETVLNRNSDSAIHLWSGPGLHGRGGRKPEYHSPADFFSCHNLILPTPETIRRGMPAAPTSDGIYANDLFNFASSAQMKSEMHIKSNMVLTVPCVMAVDGMVIRPGLNLSTSRDRREHYLIGLAGHNLSHDGVVALAAKAPDDIIAELRRHKWIASANEVHITTLCRYPGDGVGLLV